MFPAFAWLVLAGAAYAQVTTLDSKYTPSLFANGPQLPVDMVSRPGFNDLLVTEEEGVIKRIDGQTGAVTVFASVPSDIPPDRGLYTLHGIGADSMGNVFAPALVTSPATSPVLEFSSSGSLLTRLGFPGYGIAVALDSAGNLYVISQPVPNGRGGEAVYEYTKPYSSPPTLFASGFSDLQTIAFNAAGDLFGADANTGIIYKITPGGMTTASHTIIASGIAQAFSIAIDPISQTVFVGNRDGTVKNIDSSGNVSVFASGFSSGSANATAFDQSGNLYVADQFTSAIWKFTRIVGTTISPNIGGNAGSVTVQIVGTTLQSNATVQLINSGSTITGTNTSLSSPSVLQTTFDLTSASPGVWDAIVTNSDGSTAIIPAGFTVVEGGAPDVSVSIVGLDKIRIGSTQTYYLSVKNSGLIDAPFVEADVPSLPGPAAPAVFGPFTLAQYIGLLPSNSSKNIAYQISGEAGACSNQPANLRTVSNQDPCEKFKAANDSLEAALAVLYAARLANLLLWQNSILPPSNGGNAICFDPSKPFTKSLCDTFENTDQFLDKVLIQDAESAQNSLCFEAALAGCDLGCGRPSAADILKGLADSTEKQVESLKMLFESATIPPGAVAAADDQIAIFRTQALSLPNTLANYPPPNSPLLTTSFAPDSSSTISICPVSSLDPNDISGTLGYGNNHWVALKDKLNYEILFTNEATATAPAQSVSITDVFAPSILDLGTLNVQAIGVGQSQWLMPSTPLVLAPLSTSFDLRPSLNVIVNVSAVVDPVSGKLTITFLSRDPDTGNPTSDPLGGFLQPGVQGNVLLTINSRPGTPTATSLSDSATITFDVNPPINTSVWSNLLDGAPPTSKVETLPTNQLNSCFRPQWSGSDTGSGIESFNIFVSDNGSLYSTWLTGTTLSSAIFRGQAGHSYSFYSQAVDFVGNAEVAKTSADASTSVPIGASCNGRPSVSGIITTKSATGTTETLTIQLTNTGVGDSPTASLNRITFRTLSGSGQVSLNGPSLPINMGGLNAGANTSVQLNLNVPASVKEFMITEQGSIQDVAGSSYSFSVGQTVFP